MPNYYECGAPGKERKSGSAKLGRPRKCLANEPEYTGINVDEDIKRKFRIGLRLYYNTRATRPLTLAYNDTISNLFNIGYRLEGDTQVPILPPAHELPSLAQFKYWYRKERDLKKTLLARQGERDYNLNYRETLGSSTLEAFGPGSRFQIDATIGDVYLVHRYNRFWIIGKPVIYAIIDVFSRLIAGIYVGLEGPSWLGAMMALENAATDKVKFCAEYGIEITKDQWPSCHLPDLLTADRGEMVGDKPTHLIKSLRVDVENLPPFRADWKGIIEQYFDLSNERLIHWLPGAVRKRIRERGERDYRLDAKLDLDQFTKLVIECVLYHNNEHRMSWYLRDEFMISDDIEPYPIELWNWGVGHRGGHLRKESQDIIRLNLMPFDTATVTEHGILFGPMLYSCDTALKEQWFLHARGNGWKVPMSYDPRITNHIYLRKKDGKGFEKCSLLESQARYKDRRLEEVEDLIEYEKFLNDESKSRGMQAQARLGAKINSVVEEATKMTDAAQIDGISNKRKTDGIKEHRREERESRRVEQGWILEPDNGKGSEINSKVLPFPDKLQAEPQGRDIDSEYIPPPNHIELLRKLQKGTSNDGQD